MLPIDDAVADRAGELGADLHDHGTNLATPDLLIAGTAIFHNLAVVTNNVQHFSRVSGLTVVNWLQP